MGIFSFFKKKSKPLPQPENQHQQPQHEHSNTISVFKDERFPISEDDFYKQKSDYSSMSDIHYYVYEFIHTGLFH